MKRHVNALTARKNLGELLESVYYRGDEVVIERAGKPMAVLIPLEQYARLEKQKDEFIKFMEEIWANRSPVEDPEELEQMIIDEVMELRYGKKAK